MPCGNLKEGRTKALWMIHLERCGVQGECATETGKIWCQPIIINLVDRIFQRWSRQYLPFHLLFQIFPFTCQKVESNSSLESRWAWDSLVTSRMWQRTQCVFWDQVKDTAAITAVPPCCGHHAVWKPSYMERPHAAFPAALVLQSLEAGTRLESE